MFLPILIIYFVGTRHPQWHTWVHHYFHLSYFLKHSIGRHTCRKILNFPLFANFSMIPMRAQLEKKFNEKQNKINGTRIKLRNFAVVAFIHFFDWVNALIRPTRWILIKSKRMRRVKCEKFGEQMGNVSQKFPSHTDALTHLLLLLLLQQSARIAAL